MHRGESVYTGQEVRVRNLHFCLHPYPPEDTASSLESGVILMAGQPVMLMENLPGEDMQQL